MKNKQGFTLIELMIVVAIIAIIAAVAIPNLIRSRMNANESAAIKTCKTIYDAQGSYYSRNGNIAPDWATLTAGPVPYLSGNNWVDGVVKSGYQFSMGIVDAYSCTVSAIPDALDSSGSRAFFCDTGGAVHEVDGAGPATDADPLISN